MYSEGHYKITTARDIRRDDNSNTKEDIVEIDIADTNITMNIQVPDWVVDLVSHDWIQELEDKEEKAMSRAVIKHQEYTYSADNGILTLKSNEGKNEYERL